MANPAATRSDHLPTNGRAPQSVLVVGAGPVGLVAACELARHGVVPRLIDTLPEPTKEYRAVGVQPRSLEMLETLGALDRISARSLPQVAIEIDQLHPDGLEALVRMDLTGLPTRYSGMLNLPQTETEAVLRERAAELGVTVDQGTTLTSLTMDDTGADATLATPAGEEHARFGWVVGADGGHSTVRHLVGSKLEGRFDNRSHFIVADISIECRYARDTTRLFASPRGLTVMMCMRNNRSRLLFQIPDPGKDPGEPTLDRVQQLAQERMGADVRIYDPETMNYYSIHHAQVPQYRVNRALLAGDAAHIHSPAGGQGMNTGMQDAANLAWKLALVCRDLADPAILDSYHAERHPIGAEVVRRTTVMADGMTLSGLPARARNTAMKAMSHVRPAREAMAESIAEVSVSYRHSPITGQTGRRPLTAPHPGSHAADLDGLRTGDGEPVRVADLLRRRPGHLLLALTDDAALVDRLQDVLGPVGTVVPVVSDPDVVPDQGIVDHERVVADHYGVGADGVALLRPDGYFGYLATAPDPTALRDYLATQLRVLHRG